MDLIRGSRQGHSPFDIIRKFTDEGEEFWSARDLAKEFKYSRWEDVEALIRRAKIACRENRQSVSHNFRDAPKVFTHPSGRQQVVADVEMTRYGCYMFALSGNSTKPEIAAAKHYFATMTRVAEVEAVVVVQEAPAPIARAWSERFRESYQPHLRDIQINHPGCFTVVSTLVGQMLGMEDELIRHMLEPAPSDRPDVSIGKHWAVYRFHSGLPPAEKFATLYLPGSAQTSMLIR